MKKKNNKNDLSGMIKELIIIYQQISKDKNIMNVQYYNENEIANGFTLGKNLNKINENNYCEKINQIINDEEYQLIFIDLSVITMYLIFDNNKKLVSSSFSFIPYSESSKIEELSRYIRIDYDEKNKIEFTHSLVHTHIGPCKNNIRIPVDHIVTPSEFVYIILKYYYQDDSDIIKKFKVEQIDKEVLTTSEREKLFISFNKKKQI